MSDRTKIPYVDATWNPPCIYTHPCRPASPGCKNCYARRFLSRGLIKEIPDTDRLPLHWRKSRSILLPSMGDLFHSGYKNFGHVIDILLTMIKAPQHKYLLLTKRANRMLQLFSSFPIWHPPNNLWIGISAENQKFLNMRLSCLFDIPAVHRWLSLEPLLGLIVIPPESLKKIDYVVVGCETGPGHQHGNLVWIAKIVRQCKEAGIKCFVKQIELNGRVSYDPSEWPKELRVRNQI